MCTLSAYRQLRVHDLLTEVRARIHRLYIYTEVLECVVNVAVGLVHVFLGHVAESLSRHLHPLVMITPVESLAQIPAVRVQREFRLSRADESLQESRHGFAPRRKL